MSIKNKIGILDPDGKNPNPLTDKPYSDEYKELAKKWSNFPVYNQITTIVDDIEKSQVYLVVAATGSGKSVLIPKIVLHTFNYDAKIVMTLPKQMIAESAAQFASATLDVELGGIVGYKYRGSPSDSMSKNTKLLYATDGTIRAKLLRDPYLKEFDCVIIDEAHERSVQIDFLIYLLRNTIKLRPEFKLIIMSATINSEIFANYFRDFKFKAIDVGGARTFPIESIFAKEEMNYPQILTEGFKTLIKIMEDDKMENEKEAHDIIFFVISSNDAYDLCRMLNRHIQKEKKGKCKITCNGDVYCVELFSGVDDRTKELAQDRHLYKKSKKYNRKVVVATNVAESSLTIDGVKYVIDTGYQLRNSYDVRVRAKKLDRELITKSQATQRMGRAGRTEPGKCYHLYTQEQFDKKMKKFPEPDIQINDITSECLNLLKQDNIQTVQKLVEILTNFIEPPKEDYIKLAINNLEKIGAIKNNIITPLGKFLERVPGNDLFMSNALLYSKIYNCSHEMIKILAITDACKRNVNDMYNLTSLKVKDTEDEDEKKRVAELEKQFKKSRMKYASTRGDQFSLLNLYEEFLEFCHKNDMENKVGDRRFYERLPSNKADKLAKWINERFIKKSTLYKINMYEHNLRRRMRGSFGREFNYQGLGIQMINEVKEFEADDRTTYCLYMGFFDNMATKMSDGKKYKTKYTQNLQLNKISFLNLRDTLPKIICFAELFVMSGKSDVNFSFQIPNKVINIIKN